MSVLPGITLDYLRRLAAVEVFVYAVAACEREAMQIDRMTTMFLVPVEAFGGGSDIRKSLSIESSRLRGMGSMDSRTKAYLARQDEIVEQLNAALALGDTELVERLEQEYRDEQAQQDQEELAEIRKGLSDLDVRADKRTVQALRRWVA